MKIAEKRVSLVELFYDLVFVYMIAKATSLIHHLHDGVVAPLTLLIFAVVVIVFINSWMIQTVFTNRYGKQSWTDIIFSFINMGIILYMSNAFSDKINRQLSVFCIAAGLLSLTLALQYLIVYFKTKNLDDRKIAEAFFAILLVRTICLLVGGILSNWLGVGIALAGIIVSWIAPAFTGHLTNKHPIIFGHLLERLTALIIIMFGETITGIADYFTARNFSILSVLIFIMVVGLFFTYIVEFDHIIDEKKQGQTGNKLIYLHYFILFGISMFTVALKFINEKEANNYFAVSFLYIGIILIYIGIGLTNNYNKAEMHFTVKNILNVAIITLVGWGLALLFSNFTQVVVITTFVIIINAAMLTYFMSKNSRRTN